MWSDEGGGGGRQCYEVVKAMAVRKVGKGKYGMEVWERERGEKREEQGGDETEKCKKQKCTAALFTNNEPVSFRDKSSPSIHLFQPPPSLPSPSLFQ